MKKMKTKLALLIAVLVLGIFVLNTSAKKANMPKPEDAVPIWGHLDEELTEYEDGTVIIRYSLVCPSNFHILKWCIWPAK